MLDNNLLRSARSLLILWIHHNNTSNRKQTAFQQKKKRTDGCCTKNTHEISRHAIRLLKQDDAAHCRSKISDKPW
jgi:hypothetical protein